jgi:hypothetical protein
MQYVEKKLVTILGKDPAFKRGRALSTRTCRGIQTEELATRRK